MPRGQKAKEGDTMVNALGYHNTRTRDGWRLTHHLVAERKLGRPLRDEIVRFKDGDKRNLDPGNIEVLAKNKQSVRRRKARLEANLVDIVMQLIAVNEELGEENPKLKELLEL
jgi:hypothetical protein